MMKIYISAAGLIIAQVFSLISTGVLYGKSPTSTCRFGGKIFIYYEANMRKLADIKNSGSNKLSELYNYI